MKRSLMVVEVLIVMALVAAVAGCGGSGCPSCPSAERQDISAAELQTMMNDGQPLVLVDVRTLSEFEAGHIPGSVNLPLSDIETWAETLNQQTRTCCICGSGNRSRTAADALIAKGFPRVYNLLGGMNGWPGDIETGDGSCPVCP